MEKKKKDNRNPSARTACSAHYIFRAEKMEYI